MTNKLLKMQNINQEAIERLNDLIESFKETGTFDDATVNYYQNHIEIMSYVIDSEANLCDNTPLKNFASDRFSVGYTPTTARLDMGEFIDIPYDILKENVPECTQFDEDDDGDLGCDIVSVPKKYWGCVKNDINSIELFISNVELHAFLCTLEDKLPDKIFNYVKAFYTTLPVNYCETVDITKANYDILHSILLCDYLDHRIGSYRHNKVNAFFRLAITRHVEVVVSALNRLHNVKSLPMVTLYHECDEFVDIVHYEQSWKYALHNCPDTAVKLLLLNDDFKGMRTYMYELLYALICTHPHFAVEWINSHEEYMNELKPYSFSNVGHNLLVACWSSCSCEVLKLLTDLNHIPFGLKTVAIISKCMTQPCTQPTNVRKVFTKKFFESVNVSLRHLDVVEMALCGKKECVDYIYSKCEHIDLSIQPNQIVDVLQKGGIKKCRQVIMTLFPPEKCNNHYSFYLILFNLRDKISKIIPEKYFDMKYMLTDKSWLKFIDCPNKEVEICDFFLTLIKLNNHVTKYDLFQFFIDKHFDFNNINEFMSINVINELDLGANSLNLFNKFKHRTTYDQLTPEHILVAKCMISHGYIPTVGNVFNASISHKNKFNRGDLLQLMLTEHQKNRSNRSKNKKAKQLITHDDAVEYANIRLSLFIKATFIFKDGQVVVRPIRRHDLFQYNQHDIIKMKLAYVNSHIPNDLRDKMLSITEMGAKLLIELLSK